MKSLRGVRLSKLRSFTTFAIILLLCLGAYQNCSNVKLTQLSANEIASIAGATKLPPPGAHKGAVRVLVFMDQSFSMIQGKCPTDLDGSNPKPDGNATGCAPQPGIDPEAHRYDVLDQWIQQLIDDQALEPAKVAIVPFSGGHYERPTAAERRSGKFKFQGLNEAKALAKELREEHMTDLAKAKANPNDTTKFMGTTVPYPSLTYANSLMENEMKALDAEGKLETSQLRFIYISDGAFKPTEPMIQKALDLVGCPRSCSGSSSSHPACDSSACGIEGYTCLQQICEIEIPRKFTEWFGDPANNKFELILTQLQDIQSLPEKVGGGNLVMHLIRIHPERLGVDETEAEGVANPTKNIFDEIYKRLPVVKKSEIKSSKPPFNIGGRGGLHESYRINSFYAMNLNMFVDRFGKTVIDSDGDGLSDNEEVSLGYNPNVARSNGICLDGITHLYGCRTFGCSYKYDLDGDGLNECEERTIETDPASGDSDFDGILDLHEVLRGLNPNRNEQNDAVTTVGLTDQDNFRAGVFPNVSIYNLKPEQWINLQVQMEGYSSEEGSSMPLYSIKAHSMPLIQTNFSKDAVALTRDRNGLSPWDKRYAVYSGDHSPLDNHIIFVARVASYENPNDVYWLMSKKTIQPAGPGTPVSVPLSFLDLFEIPIMNGTP